MKKIILILVPLLTISCFLERPDNLLTATRNLDYQKVKAYVLSGADINEKDHNGFTPLITAAYYGNAPIAKYLCENGADVNLQTNDGWTALLYASFYGFEDVVKILLKYNASVDIINKYGYTALWYAEKNKNEGIIKMLKDSGAKPLLSL